MILPTSFGTLSLKTMPSFSFPVNFCFSAYKHCDFSQLTKSADLSPACLGNFFFCSSLHLNLSSLVLWTRQIKIWSCTGIKVWFWYPELFKKWMLLNPLKFNKLHWALKFNSSMAVTILSKQLLQFPRDGCSWEFNRNSWCCSHGSGQYCVASLILMLSIRMLPIFRLTVRLKQLILFRWLWYFSLWQMGWYNTCINTYLQKK